MAPPPPTSLYLAPTKALAHDQARVCAELAVPGWRVATVDGDTDPADRQWARDHAHHVLTNPDLLHALAAAEPYPLGLVPALAALRGGGRVASLSRGLRRPGRRACCAGCDGSPRTTAPIRPSRC